ncbi:vitamin K epoxide reductase family protein [Flavobacterium sp. 9AF]|uniref:vitamin K epoxide reductase family protein n=1 Tax=Flavobacterium sp. 9AF TaxID=2653142 RepID=UPI0013585E1F|nr:vitamin K epoxide reductase family protein [Flavobacterium sp. 9AF]
MQYLIENFLEINNYNNERTSFENLYLSHPNYPSLYAITDSLDLLQIENVAAQVPKEQFTALPDNFLAVFADDIVLVNKKDSSIMIEKEKEGKKKLSTDEFLLQWNGIVVAIEPNEVVSSSKKVTSNKYVICFLILLLVLALQYPFYNFLSFLSLVVNSVGLFLSIIIIDEKLNKTEGVVSKICTFSSNTSCESVLKSDSARIASWLDFSDLPLVFFGSSLLFLHFSPGAYPILNLISLLSLPIVGYSIWLQKIKLNKWCVLCLGISSLLVIQSIFFMIYTLDFNFNYKSLLQAFVIVLPIWFAIKPVLFKKVTLEQENLKLLKFKRNFSIFSSLEKPVDLLDRFRGLEKIRLGKSSAPVTVDLILSPSCGHCHTAFSEGLSLMRQFPDKVNLHLFFNLNISNADNPYLVVAKSLLQINKNNEQKVLEALEDWHIKRMTLKEWTDKWQEPLDMSVENDLREQYEWCLENEFNYTPVKIVNGNLYPSEYELGELKYFLSEIEEKQELVLV